MSPEPRAGGDADAVHTPSATPPPTPPPSAYSDATAASEPEPTVRASTPGPPTATHKSDDKPDPVHESDTGPKATTPTVQSAETMLPTTAPLSPTTPTLSPLTPTLSPTTPPLTPVRTRSPFPTRRAAPVTGTASVSVSTRVDAPRHARAPGSGSASSMAALLAPGTPRLSRSHSSAGVERTSDRLGHAGHAHGVGPAGHASCSPAKGLVSAPSRSGAAASAASVTAEGLFRSTSLDLPSPTMGNFPSTPAGASSTATPTPRSPKTPRRSRKGKERAQGDEDGAANVSGARRGLRELVARDEGGRPRAVSRAASTADVTRVAVPPDRDYSPRRYYVLTNAGKPVFSYNHGDDDDTMTNMMGVVQALISIFAESEDRLRCIIRGRTRIAFLLKAPLYFFAVSDWGEPEHVLRMQLEYINLQIMSVVTGAQIARVFQRRSNFDLAPLIAGSEIFVEKLITRCQDDLSFLTTTLQPLRMAPALRDTAASALIPPAKFKDLLYVLLIAGGRIVTLLRPRRHAVHPSDMHLLLNTLATSTTLRTVDTWLPLCLPKFNPAGFVHAYISFIAEDVGLVFISADRDAFEPLKGWKEVVLATLQRDGALAKIEASVRAHPFFVSALGSPGLRHFAYKSRGLIQLTTPEWEEPYLPGTTARHRLVTLYQRVQDALYARSGQGAPLKLVYMATAHEAVLGWLTKPFELYITVSPHLPMSAVVATANRVAKWVNAEESRLFLKDAPVF